VCQRGLLGRAGVVEGETEHLDEEVDGVAGQLALGPAPITVFDQQARVSGQFEVVGGPGDQFQVALLEQRRQRCHPCGADLFARPARTLGGGRITGVVGRSHFASGVE